MRSLKSLIKFNLVQVQKWSLALEKTTDLELDLVYD
jgi:hypothetical protein